MLAPIHWYSQGCKELLNPRFFFVIVAVLLDRIVGNVLRDIVDTSHASLVAFFEIINFAWPPDI